MPNYVGVPQIYPKLLEIRKSKTAEFKYNKYWNKEYSLRYYQVIGALHFMLLERMVLGDAVGIGKCVAKDTYIASSKGLIKIGDFFSEDLKEDTFYQSPDGLKILTRSGIELVESLYYSGIKEGLKIATRKGFELTGLGHHPILVASSEGVLFKTLAELKVGDHVCINRKGVFSDSLFQINYNVDSYNAKEYNKPDFIDEKLAELLGYYVSEGNSHRKQSYQITQFDTEIHNNIRSLLKDIFNYEQNTDVKDYSTSIQVNSVYITQLFKHLGVKIEGKSGGQEIPYSILQSPKNIIRSFLQAYFEGDGCVELGTKIVSCCSKSEELIKQIQIVLLLFGIVSSRRKRAVKIKNGRNDYWYLSIFGKDVDLFKFEIGFISLRKVKELESICGVKRNTNVDLIPYSKNMYKQAMANIITYLKKQPEQSGFSKKGSGWKGLVGLPFKRAIEECIYYKRRSSYPILKEYIEKVTEHKLEECVSNIEDLKTTLKDNFFFDTIKNIEPKTTEFYDFVVPEGHNFTGNGFVNHNTVQLISSYIFMLEKDPTLKLLIVGPKSANGQWREEFQKFTTGITVRVIYNEYKELTGNKARKLQYQEFKENVMVTSFSTVMEEYEFIKEAVGSNYMFVVDEVQACKNYKTKTHFSCKFLADQAKRVYGLSATIIKNGLEEVWGIYDVIVPGLFGKITKFRETYCKQKLMKLVINKKIRYIPKTIGYKNLELFRNTLDPYFLIRKKDDVASELPGLISKKIVLEMLPDQKELYRQALAGVLYEERVKQDFFDINDRMRQMMVIDEKTLKLYEERKDKYEKFLSPDGKKRGKLAALTYCQMISNGPMLLKHPGESSKEEELDRLLREELLTEKIIVYTRFSSGIPYLEVICERAGISYTKITGDVDGKERDSGRLKFQNDPNCRLIFITAAGSAALNLQAAGVIIFYDTPWSYGDLYQTIGRAQRIGSIQDHILILHLVNKGTIDYRVLERVSEKKNLSDMVVGDTAKGALDFEAHENDVIEGLYTDLIKDAEDFK